MDTPAGSTVDVDVNVDADADDDYDEIPLQHKRPFGSGLHRKTVAFVPASASDGCLNSTDHVNTAAKPKQLDVADLYLSMVLSKDNKTANEAVQVGETGAAICEVCRLPLESEPAPAGSSDVDDGNSSSSKKDGGKVHENSFAHQVCLPHSYPPSALDRSRMGLSYLSQYGWDPDSRKGLGAAEQGITFPVKATPKYNNLGVGIHVPKNLPPPREKKERLLDAGKVRKQARKDKRKAERIHQQLFGNQDLEKYLGPGALG
ncbi:hypothetical protein B0T22DRAFT_457685 [Podospora appendiculata]|uniref:G-patch domain-containing protein n=1 Tax=Podospora appendiculata TaxID=314037 RepID=A0AAE0X7R6_9PEZI|nr:hypothetical protein B0T22DRAFT_457685 [Podospora appendiculata]